MALPGLFIALLALVPYARSESAAIHAPLSVAGPERRPLFCSKLDLPLPLTGRMPGMVPALLLRFGDGQAAAAAWPAMDREDAPAGWLETFVGTGLPAALFSLAAVNAFAPNWLPKGTGDRLGLKGRGRTPPLTGIEPGSPP